MIYEWLKPGTGTAMSVELDYSIQFEDDEQPGGENLKRVRYRRLITEFL